MENNEVTSAANHVFNIPLILDAILPDLSFNEVLSLRLLNRCCAMLASSYLRRHHEAILRVKTSLDLSETMDLVSLITNRKNVDNRLGPGPWSGLQVNLGLFSKDLIEIFATQVGTCFPSFRAFFGDNCMLYEADLKLALFLSQLPTSLENLCLIGHLSEFGNLAVDTLQVQFSKLTKLQYLSDQGMCKDFNATICKLVPNLMEISIMEDAYDSMLTADYAYRNLNGFHKYWTEPHKLLPVVSYLGLLMYTSSPLGLSHFMDLVDIGFPCRKLKLALVSGLAPNHSYQLSLEELLRNSATTLTDLEILIFSPIESSINQFKLPTFKNLTSLQIQMKSDSIGRSLTSAFEAFKSHKFPRLKYLTFYEYGGPLNPIQAPIPTVTHLKLVSYSNRQEYEEDQKFLLHQCLPNLKSLIALNLTFKVKQHVITKLKDLEILELGDFSKETSSFGTPEDLWHLYTGGAPLPCTKKTDDLNNTSTNDQGHGETPPYFNSRPLPSLENLKHLKILRIRVKSKLELDAIIFMTRERKLPQLHELEIQLQSIIVNSTHIETLSNYHTQVSFT